MGDVDVRWMSNDVVVATAIDVVVYMHDNSGIMLSVPPNTQADHLFEMLLSEMKVP